MIDETEHPGHALENPLIVGIDLAGGNPDLNGLLIERRQASEVCYAPSRTARL